MASHSITRLVQRSAAVIPHSLAPSDVRYVLRQNGAAWRFTFVRHPYSRFQSALRLVPPAMRGKSIERLSAEMPHFIPQAEFMGSGLFDFVGRFEELERDFATVKDRLGLKRSIVFGKNVKNPKGEISDGDLSPETKEKIDTFYSKDFAILGYSMGTVECTS